MDEELDPEVIKRTQISLGKYIKRPPLSEKLLKKPPFRFLHDIITTVLKTTGFFEGLFDDNELISENVKDRESKILFLNKAISVISLTTGKTLSVKPSKIVAGQEPMKTNELLQCLASALDNNLSSKEAVIKYYENSKKQMKDPVEVTSKKDSNKSQKKNIDSKKNSSKNDNSTSKKKESSEPPVTKKEKETANDKTRKKESGPVKNESRNKTIRPQVVPKKIIGDAKLKSRSKTQLSETKSEMSSVVAEQINSDIQNIQHNIDEKPVIDAHTIPDNKAEVIDTDIQDAIIKSVTEVDLKAVQSENITEIEKENHESLFENPHSAISEINELYPNENHTARKSSVALGEDNSQNSQLNSVEPENHGIESERVTTEQESNINKVLSTPIKKESNMPRSASVRPSSSRPGAPRPKDKFENLISDNDSHLLGKVNIIVENAQTEEEDDSSIIIMEQQESSAIVSAEKQEELTLSLNGNEHGHLVQQILNSQKEFSQVSGKTEIEWQFGAQKAKVAQHEEIEQLRYNIQALTRVSNPLGKLLDHIQEDVEVMRQELQQWTNIFEEISKEIQKQKTLNEDSLLPLQMKLKQLELDIQEKCEKINDLKVLIYKNSSRIEKLLANGSVQ